MVHQHQHVVNMHTCYPHGVSRGLPLSRRGCINLTRVGRLALTQGTEHNNALEVMRFLCCTFLNCCHRDA